MTVTPDHDSRMLTALVQLHDALKAAPLALDVPGAAELRVSRQQLIEQLEDYVLPRQMTVEAPLLAVVGGSTGAGKSTLVNSLVGRRVTAPGLLRPTTRSAVLVHHPDDAQWFGQDRLLPELVRVEQPTDDRHSLQLVASDTMPPGLAILDAPDVDSVEEGNRVLATQLLAAADLWLFVTSAARYSDQVPWEHLKRAADRSTSVAIVLDRTPADAVRTVATHLARMLAARGLKDSPLFTVAEAPVSEDGLLDASVVADVRAWLVSLAEDPGARSAVVRQTLDGTVRSLARQAHGLADALTLQLNAASALRDAATTAYDEAEQRAVAAATDGTLLRGEVAVRWREFAGTGELLRSLEGRVGLIRDRLVNAVKGSGQQAERVAVAIESAVELMVVDHAEDAATATAAAWAELGTAGPVLAGADDLGRASGGLRRSVEGEVRAWQQQLTELVKADDADRRTSRYLAYGARGLAVTLAVTVLADTAPGDRESGAEVGRTLLDAVFGEHAASLVARGRADLERRIGSLIAAERGRALGLLDGLGLDGEAGRLVRSAARRVDDRRYEQSRPDSEPLP
ncbi:ABC transporter [Nocardioides sp. Root1257]|uniref:dynamin family protein n=1 Tax=unclassified Nocardioides TaxID=2615069 RepID=UPI00070014E6|nr:MULTISPECIES: dynamin family protein [unclassified Nocardioides]KQW49376.1 ABC transporter [Nocardioides sp. Root1257]KRC48550.1 ABC transporter [Nocardioides sp. Root224]